MIITELMPAGDLDTILSSRKINLSLFIRMKMARDAAGEHHDSTTILICFSWNVLATSE